MSDENPRNIKPLLSATGQGLIVVMTTLAGFLAGPSDKIELPARLTTSVLGALLGIVGVWGYWTFSLWKRDSKREQIKDAISKGRIICHCTEDGEILTFHCGLGGSGVDVYCCKVCGNYHVTHPAGETLISDHTQFNPPLPERSRKAWLEHSRRSRGEK